MPAPDPPLQVVVLYRSALPTRVEAALRAASPDPPLLSLARALTSTESWCRQRPAVFVVRVAPAPVLVAIGRFGPVELERLHHLHDQLDRMLPRTIVLDHRAVEEGCGRLAELLRGRFGPEEIASMRLVAVPRGGLVVLGLLSYVLGLPRHQLGAWEGRPTAAGAGRLVVVDDCVISGLRVAQFLEHRKDERDIVVATLYSHPDLRAALPERIPSVRDIVSAYDLHDHAPEAEGDGYDAWHARWRERSDPRSSWIGQPDHVCFPWGEPESSAWNRVSDREEPGWTMIPPELSLKHRGRPASEALSVQIQTRSGGGHVPTSRVVYADLDGDIVVGNLESGEAFALDGVAASMWREILSRPDDDAAAAAVARAYGADEADVLTDTRTFARDLRAAGLIERAGP